MDDDNEESQSARKSQRKKKRVRIMKKDTYSHQTTLRDTKDDLIERQYDKS